ncbi:MAG: carboxypeptidase-like regulatory domain-containing protein, partial [Planctomycetota bacterium]
MTLRVAATALLVACTLVGLIFWLAADEAVMPTSSTADSSAENSSGFPVAAGTSPGRSETASPNFEASLTPGLTQTKESRAPVEPSGAFAIEGQVLTGDGHPLAEANVKVLRYRRMLFTHQALDLIGGMSPESLRVSEVRCNHQGLFQAALPGPGEYLVEVSSPGRTTAIEAPVRITHQEPRSFIFFTLPPAVVISGVLREAGGRRLANVPLKLLDLVQGEPQSYHSFRTFSHADGSFSFEGLEPRRGKTGVQTCAL